MSSTEQNRRWRAEHPEKRHAQKRKNYSQTQGGANTGAAWASWEIELVLNHSIPDRQLAKQLGRSVQAIQLKRSRSK